MPSHVKFRGAQSEMERAYMRALKHPVDFPRWAHNGMMRVWLEGQGRMWRYIGEYVAGKESNRGPCNARCATCAHNGAAWRGFYTQILQEEARLSRLEEERSK